MIHYEYLVVSDTNNIIDYIFASTKYKVIRGASMILDSLNTKETKKIIQQFNGQLLSMGGGEVRVLFQTEDEAKTYIEQLNKLYYENTDEVTITTALVKRKQNEPMHEWIERGESELRLAEMTYGKKKPSSTPISPIMKRCESCYNRVAEKEVTIFGHLKAFYCYSCYLKQKVVNETRTLLESHEILDFSGLTEIYEQLFETSSNAKIVKNLRKLVDENRGDSMIGFVYVDGKKIGSLFKTQLQSNLPDREFIEQYQNLSKHIHESLITSAVRTHHLFEQFGIELYVDYALVGGDDLAAVLNGRYVVPYTYYLLKFFEEETKKRLGTTQHLAAGVVITKSNFPVHQLFDLSYELMARTKRNNEGSSLDFEVINDSAIQTIEEKRSQIISKKRRLNGEGYSIHKNEGCSIKDLYSVGQTLKLTGFPTSKMKDVFQITTEENEQLLRFRWIEWRSKMDKKQREIFDNWSEQFKITPFAFSKGEVPFTPLRDLFNLYDYIEMGVRLE